jgi:hypothetical protein
MWPPASAACQRPMLCEIAPSFLDEFQFDSG